MATSKNYSAKELALVIAALISFTAGMTILIISRKWQTALISLVVLFTFCYILVHFFVQHFISRRIKLIYKFIYQTKASKKEEIYYKYILPKKTIDEVEKDVERW